MSQQHDNALATLAARAYAGAAAARRSWFERHPEARRRLSRPVVSVGNLRAGGSGKTPLVALLARWLRDRGEHPSILSRGYGRRARPDGIVVVSDGLHVRADLDRAGDEPLMLARALDGVAVLACPDRYLAGCLAERRLGCTVHLLDDGYQHLALEREINLLLVAPEDVASPRVLPAGRLREPLDAARAADALLVTTPKEDEAEAIGVRLGVAPVFRVRRIEGTVKLADAVGRAVEPAPGTRVLAVAGIAEPERFIDGLRASGWNVAGTLIFADHHRYGPRDLEAIGRSAAAAHAVMVVTTGKDLVRLLPLRPFPLPVASAGLDLSIDPKERFDDWLGRRLETCGKGAADRGRVEA